MMAKVTHLKVAPHTRGVGATEDAPLIGRKVDQYVLPQHSLIPEGLVAMLTFQY